MPVATMALVGYCPPDSLLLGKAQVSKSMTFELLLNRKGPFLLVVAYMGNLPRKTSDQKGKQPQLGCGSNTCAQ